MASSKKLTPYNIDSVLRWRVVQYIGVTSVMWVIASVLWGIASVLWRLFSAVGITLVYVGENISTVGK